jgi:hypothetical protein
MKTRFRTFVAVVTGLALCACANPYVNQIKALDARYAAGKISRKEYIAERNYLEVQKAQVDRENARTALAAAAIGTAIAGTAIQAANTPSAPGGGAPRGGAPGGGGPPH